MTEDKEYLTRLRLWDDDPWICAQNIAYKIAEDPDYSAKYGRRAILALVRGLAMTPAERLVLCLTADAVIAAALNPCARLEVAALIEARRKMDDEAHMIAQEKADG